MNTLIKKIVFLLKRGSFLQALWEYIVRNNPVKLNVLRHKPEFLIIGAMKSGTTYLFNILKHHPEIKVPKQKEIQFFSINYRLGVNWYSYQFPFKFDKNKISGEASPYYIYHPLAAKRAHAFNPEFKIIILLRNPVDRAISHYNMVVNHRKMSWEPSILLNIDKEIKIQESLENSSIRDQTYISKIHRDYSFIRRGIYLYQIKNWEEYFPTTNILVVKSEDLYSDAEKTLTQVCEFLQISSDPNSLNINVDKFEGRYEQKINEDIFTALKAFYKPHNIELEKHLKKKFNWD